MKKKLLSLVLAGAMVASTSVSAFATTTDKPYEVQPDSATNAEVEIRGDVESSEGNVLPGSVEVTVPTNASFTVKKNGTLEAGSMVIRNKGNSKVSVIASSFKDTNGINGINLVKVENDLTKDDRKKVFLKLTGGDEDIILTSEGTGKMYKGSDLSTEITETTNFEIKKIEPQGELRLQLTGRGSECKDSETTEAVSDNFRLVLKIKQVKN